MSGSTHRNSEAKVEEARRLEAELDEARGRIAELTEALARERRALEARTAETEEFTYIASHDLQEPLRKLTAFADLLRRDLGAGLPERAARDLGFLTDAARRMRGLVDGLLALSRAGRMPLKPQSVALGECADLALRALAAPVAARQAEISRDDLPTVCADKAVLAQLYEHLIGNALKFAGEARPAIRLTAEQAGDRVILGVRDNGIGIHPRYAERIFLPFKRLHGRSEREGAGIGLAISRKIVERHGGRIWVESEPGQGAHFRFTLDEKGTGR